MKGLVGKEAPEHVLVRWLVGLAAICVGPGTACSQDSESVCGWEVEFAFARSTWGSAL